MEIAFVIMRQIGVMFILVFIGYFLFRTEKITKEGSKTIGNLLVYIVIPCVIVKSFLVDYSPERLKGVLVSALLALILLAVAMAFSHIIYKKNGIASFATAFSNAGFFGVPLIGATIGQGAVFYAASFIAFLNLFQWTFGVSMITGKSGKITVKRVITAPFMIAVVIGLFLFLTQLELPSLIAESIGHLANLNTPLAMFAIGIYLAQVGIKEMLMRKDMYYISALRLVVIPFLSIVLLLLVPNTMIEMKNALLLAAACPVGANVAIYAQMYEGDYGYAVETVVISTFLCIVTMPCIMWIAQVLWTI